MKKRCGFFNFNEESGFVSDDNIFLLKKMRECVDILIIVSSVELDQISREKLLKYSDDIYIDKKSIDIKNVFKIISPELLSEYNEIIYFDNSFFGPFCDMKSVFDTMEKKECDLWGVSKRLQYKDCFGKSIKTHLETYFLVIKEKIFKNKDFKDFLEEKKEEDITNYFENRGYIWETYLEINDLLQEDSSFHFDMMLYAPYDMLKKYKSPFIKKEVFENEKLKSFEYHLGNQISQSFCYIKEQIDYDEDMIWQYLLKKCNIALIRQNLNLTYIIPEGKNESYKNIDKKSAVFAHVYYRDLIDECTEYLSRVPENIDLYITVCDENAKKYITDNLEKIKRRNYKVLIAGNRGRDLAAFLITFRPYIEKYEYICFIHDKKTTGSKGFTTIGSTFMSLVWDNLLYNENYIEKILGLLHDNKRMGLIAPPIPYHSGYIRLIGDAWTICYKETKKLADQLNLSVDISEEFHPFAMSTSFWCRTEALMPLLKKEFKFEDFPEEPMDLDGTFSHALERILIYVAQEAGYYSAVVCNQQYGSLDLTNMEYLLSKSIKDSIGSFGTQGISDMFSGNNYKERMKLLKYVIKNKKICIYGQGNNGKNLAEFFESQGINFKYFVVSDGKTIKRNIYGHNAYYLSEIKDDIHSMGIIIAVDKLYRGEVLKNLEELGCTNYFFAT